MTYYTGQQGGKVQPLENEHRNPELLFSEHDRRQAQRALNENNNPAGSIELIDRLNSVYLANKSHQAAYYLAKLIGGDCETKDYQSDCYQ